MMILFIKILYSELFSSVVMSEFARALHVLLSVLGESELDRLEWRVQLCLPSV